MQITTNKNSAASCNFRTDTILVVCKYILILDLSSTHRKKVVGRNKINYDLGVSRLKTIIHSDPQ